MATAVNISVIGAGSAQFSLGLVKDLCLTESLAGSRVCFMASPSWSAARVSRWSPRSPPPDAPVTPPDRPWDYESGGRRFESRLAHHFHPSIGKGPVGRELVERRRTAWCPVGVHPLHGRQETRSPFSLSMERKAGHLARNDVSSP